MISEVNAYVVHPNGSSVAATFKSSDGAQHTFEFDMQHIAELAQALMSAARDASARVNPGSLSFATTMRAGRVQPHQDGFAIEFLPLVMGDQTLKISVSIPDALHLLWSFEDGLARAGIETKRDEMG